MALSTTSFSNFFSFLSPPSKSPPPPQLPLLHHHNNHRNKFIPLVLSRTETPSVTSSSSKQREREQEQEDLDLSFDSLSDSLFLESPYNVQVIIEDDENEERVVGRFRREVLRAGIIQEFKRRRYFENKQEEKKRRIQDAAKRNRRARFPRRPMDGNSRGPYNNNYWDQDDPKPEKEEDDDDNWDLPEEDVQNF